MDMMSLRRRIMGAEKTLLPREYQQVEYLESTGTQYIDLPFGFDRTDEIESRFSISTSHTNDKYMVSPVEWNTQSNRFSLGVHIGRYTAGFGGFNTGRTALIPNTPNDGNLHDWVYRDDMFRITDIDLSLDVSEIGFGATTANLRLFYGYNNNTNGKIVSYWHKKLDGTEINLIPCYRKADQKPGMYDLVSGEFYTNAGSGEFVVGEDV